ncbi:hypothetical protein CYMTET_49291 [Cymbomonas tetramitiformis]|uniref:Uncharacterized protein n=1 Tax=Cymbomonas tetramitiformis TaxID=36881 RepID=A0AAE0BS65_9CHLO|nr:hypothetical protein CYMTET_49291 [Cymbomonas tetramitiformis]
MSVSDCPWKGSPDGSMRRANSKRTRFPSDGKAELDESIQSAAGEAGSTSSSSVENKILFASTRTGRVASSCRISGAKPMSSVMKAVYSADTIRDASESDIVANALRRDAMVAVDLVEATMME